MSQLSNHPPDGLAERLALLAREHADGALDRVAYRLARAAALDALDPAAQPQGIAPTHGTEATVRIPAAASPRRHVRRGRAAAWALRGLLAGLVLLAGVLAALMWR